MELAYILVLEARFSEFESLISHHCGIATNKDLTIYNER